MKKKSLIRSTLTGVILALLMNWGCASTPASRFYSLSSLSAPVKARAGQPLSQGLSIGLGPIRFPDYLARPGIVTRRGGNTVDIAEFDLWAGSLKENFTWVLAENLSAILKTDKIILFPYFGTIPLDLRILVGVNRFEGTPGGHAVLEATWTVLEGPDKKEGFVQKSRIIEPVSGSGYLPLVTAQSRAVECLSREIAQAIEALPTPASVK